MGISSVVYNNIFKRTSSLVLATVFAAFFFERTFDLGADYIFENVNKGKLWKDIKDKYE